MPLKSFIEVNPELDFPIQNLPYGVFSTKSIPTPRVGTRIGDFVVDLAVVDEENLFDKQCGFFGVLEPAHRTSNQGVVIAVVGLAGSKIQRLEIGPLLGQLVAGDHGLLNHISREEGA